MTGLASRRMQDRLRRDQVRLDQQDRNTGLGVALDVVPALTMNDVPIAVAPDSYGYYIRHNDLLIYWFRIVFASTPGAGFMYVTPPDGIVLYVPSPGIYPHIGIFELVNVAAQTIAEGTFRSSPRGAQPTIKEAGLSSAGLARFIDNIHPWSLKIGDVLSGRVEARVAPGS